MTTEAISTDTTPAADVRAPLHVREVLWETQRLLTAAGVMMGGLHQIHGKCRLRDALADLLHQAEARVEAVRAWSENTGPGFLVGAHAEPFRKLVAEIGPPDWAEDEPAEAGT